jgi:SRSO17 transposase
MTPQEMAEVRPRLLDFAAEMLGGLPRKDQRAAGELYVRGLLTDGQRKSMQPMAARLGVDHQRLQQFITSSTWDYAAVRRNAARWFAAEQPVDALVIDDTGFPKDGTASPCVARQYSGTLGKTANCQIGVSVHLVNERASCAADWRLYCPESWDDKALDDPVRAARARRRREQARIPDDVRHTEKWRLALEMIDEMTGPGGWGVLEQITAAGGTRPVVTADAGYGDNTAFRLELEDRGWRYVAAVKGTTSAYAGDAQPVTPARGSGPGRPRKPAYPAPAVNLRQLAIAHAGQIRQVTWRQGTKATKDNPDAAMTSCFLAIRVRPANRDIPRAASGSLPDRWLLAEWPPHADEPTDYWLSNLPADTPISELVRPAKIRWRVEHDYRELKTGLGLDHFEGRSYTGWHRHVTLAVLAQAFCTMLRTDPKAPAPG